MTTASAFWIASGLLAYTYFGYPLLLAAWSRLLRPRVPPPGGHLPAVTVVVVAHNEAQCIRQKVDNLLAADYPPGSMDIIIASDGSTDDTVARAQSRRSRRVRVIPFKARRGKSAVLNDVVPSARGDVVVLADSRQRFDPQAIRALTRHFADPSVGAVGGELVLVDTCARGAELARGVGAYWRYEKMIRRFESAVDSTIGASGAIYAIRRELFEPIPEGTILDDVLIPMNIARRGYRVLFESRARAYDRPASTSAAEFRRKSRTIAGNIQLFLNQTWLLVPWKNRLWVQTVSHKFLRLLGPPALVVAFVTSGALAHQQPYGVLFVVQLLFYTSAMAGHRMRHRPNRPSFLNIPYAFCLMNWAVVVGFIQLMSGRQSVMWQANNSER